MHYFNFCVFSYDNDTALNKNEIGCLAARQTAQSRDWQQRGERKCATL